MPLLTALLRDKTNALARVHALWTLMALDGVSAAILNELVADPHAEVREHALRARPLVELHDPKLQIATARLVKLAGDPAIRVRLQAALALGDRCHDEPAALDALHENRRPRCRMIPGCDWRS